MDNLQYISLDKQTRQDALDYQSSFIIQAPAGSGKTELLTQRYLSLLAYNAEKPESIIAITFTKKAANEMKQRIIRALSSAEHPPPKETHKKITHELAKNVMQKDQKAQWQLMLSPHRLRIMTIDAFCHHITSQMPILANFGAPPKITDDPHSCYRTACENLLARINISNDRCQHAI